VVNSAQDNILKIAEKISKLGGDNGGCDFRFALVAYRDHPPQDNSYVTKVYDFTDDFPKMKKNVVRPHHQHTHGTHRTSCCVLTSRVILLIIVFPPIN
jgi:glucokinase